MFNHDCDNLRIYKVPGLATRSGDSLVARWAYYLNAIGKGLSNLRCAGHKLQLTALNAHSIGHGSKEVTNAGSLRDLASRTNDGRVVQGRQTAPLRKDVGGHCHERFANPEQDVA